MADENKMADENSEHSDDYSEFSDEYSEGEEEGEGEEGKVEEEETLNNHNPTEHFKHFIRSNLLSKEDARLLRKFFKKHPDAYFVDETLSSKTKGFAYGRFADLLRLLRDHTMLYLLDSRSFELSEHLHDVRHFSFRNAWLDSVEQRLFPCSSSYDDSRRSLRSLVDSEARLSEDIEIISSKVESLTYRKGWCEVELAKVREKKHAVSKAIDDLNAFLTF